MTPDEIKALITETLTATLETFKTDILSVTDEKNRGLAAALTKDIKKLSEKPTEPEPTEEKLTLKSLQSELGSLREQLANEKAASLRKTTSAEISKLVASSKLTQPEAAMKLFEAEYGSAIAVEDEKLFVRQGENVQSLSDCFSNFVKSNDWLLPPSGLDGADSKEQRTKAPATTETSPYLGLLNNPRN